MLSGDKEGARVHEAVSHLDDEQFESAVSTVEHAREGIGPAVLVCPRCDASIQWDLRDPAYGIGRCPCGEMPLAAGVVLTGADARAATALEAIRGGDFRGARRLVLGRFARRVRVIESLGMRLTFRRFLRHTLLGRAADLWPVQRLLEWRGLRSLGSKLTAAGQFNTYLRHRLCTPGLLGMVGLLGMLDGRRGLVLDAPCGFGHLSYLISKLIDPRRIVCTDRSAAHAYAARRFFVPHARAALAADLCRPLPLPDRAFAMIFCVDGLQYLHDKRAAVRSFMRLLRDDGVLVIGHSPNPAFPAAYLDHALTPAQHRELFKGHHVRMFPGGYLPSQHLSGEPVDLARRFTEAELEAAPMWDVIVANSASTFRSVPNVSQRMADAATNPQLNEMYRMRRTGTSVILRRRLPRVLADECRRFPQILPPHLELPTDWVSSARGRLTFANPAQLLRQYVLLDVPDEH